MSALIALLVAVGGLHGVVMRGPTTPVCQVSKPCSEPAVGAVLTFSRDGAVATRVRTGAGGWYWARLRPGVYTVQLSPAPTIGSGVQPGQVTVRDGVSARVDFQIDTGIR
jgi:hypothetical protein